MDDENELDWGEDFDAPDDDDAVSLGSAADVGEAVAEDVGPAEEPNSQEDPQDESFAVQGDNSLPLDDSQAAADDVGDEPLVSAERGASVIDSREPESGPPSSPRGAKSARNRRQRTPDRRDRARDRERDRERGGSRRGEGISRQPRGSPTKSNSNPRNAPLSPAGRSGKFHLFHPFLSY
jgi:hypothetical protein